MISTGKVDSLGASDTSRSILLARSAIYFFLPLLGDQVSTKEVMYTQSRRSTRIAQVFPLVVQGVAAPRNPFQECVSTVMISCHGCTYRSRYEVKPGDVVYLGVNPSDVGASTCSNRGEVRRVQKIRGTEQAFDVAVEFDFPGNIWGVALPPADWFPVRSEKARGSAHVGQKLRVESRVEQPMIAPQDAGRPKASHAEGNENPTAPSHSRSELMVRFVEQIHSIASEAATTALVKYRSRLLEEFRLKLNDEASQILASALSSFKVQFSRGAMKQLQDAYEAITRTSLESWRKKLGQDIEAAMEHMAVQGQQLSKRIDDMAIRSFNQLEGSLEASRTEAADRFLSRLGDRIGPLLEEAKAMVQQLEASLARLKEESQITSAQFDTQIGKTMNMKLSKAEEELQRKSAAVIEMTDEVLHSNTENFKKAALRSLQSHASSALDQFKSVLDAKMPEVSHQFLADLEHHTTCYLESVSESIAEMSRRTAIHSVQVTPLGQSS